MINLHIKALPPKERLGGYCTSTCPFRPLLFSFLNKIRTLEEAYWNLTNFDYERIVGMTGCQRPCIYHQYKFIGERQPVSFLTNNFVFSLWSVVSAIYIGSVFQKPIYQIIGNSVDINIRVT